MIGKLLIATVLLIIVIIFIYKPDFSIIPEVGTTSEKLQPISIPPTPLEFPNLRWNHMPLSVFVDSKTAEDASYAIDVRLALDTWKEITNNVISFEMTGNKTKADITVEWVDSLKAESLDAAGNADTNYLSTPNFKILTRADVQLLNTLNGKKLTHFDMKNLALHEIGHALGLSHNNIEQSIMYAKLSIPSADIKEITESEIQFLLDAYKIEAKPDMRILPNSTVTKIVDKRLLKENYYINTSIFIENSGLLDASNTTLLINADGNEVKKADIPELPIGAVYIITYTQLPVKGNFSTIQIIADSGNLINELSEENNILTLEL